MSNPALSRQVRFALENAPDALPLNDVLAIVDEFVLECSSSEEPEVLLYQFEEELQSIHHEVVDYASLHQMEVLLAVLYHLRPILPATSVISWFDLVLRPALREPKLPVQAVNHAKELIISALQRTHDTYSQKVHDFRRRLLELWLLDAFNEASSDDILEWAELQPDERAKRTRWKQNLGDTLRNFGNEQPEDFLDEINRHFKTPTSRRQILDLFLEFMDTPCFSSTVKILPHHPFMQALLYCLFFDNSSIVCGVALSLLARLLPYLAVYAPSDLRQQLPRLLAVLVRIMLWKERPKPEDEFGTGILVDRGFEQELESEANRKLQISPTILWERLEMTFGKSAQQTPNSRSFFTVLYYLYPSNVLKFFRDPVQYLTDAKLESPYVETWEEAYRPMDDIRRNGENLLRGHCSHPLLVWRDAIREISEPEFWRKYDLSRIVTESNMLDIRNATAAVKARLEADDQLESLMAGETKAPNTPEGETLLTSTSPRLLQPIDLSSGKAVISLQDMIHTSIVLKSNLDVEVVQPMSQWPQAVFLSTEHASTDQPLTLPTGVEGQNSYYVAQAISGLQREILLLRNDLNFELWLSREHSKHIGRLYQDRILMKTAEAERQGLYNKLRKYRAQVISLESELREHRQQASTAKNKYADWNTELQKKLKELREEKKNWLLEAAALRSAEKETQALFVAQGQLLAGATKKVFDLETQRKENQHKVDRLRDYERQIEQHLKIQKLWDEDFAKFNDRAEDLKAMKLQFRQMQMRLEGMEQTQAEMEDNARHYRRQIQTLEARHKQVRHRSESFQRPKVQEIAIFAAEKEQITASNTKLREENVELREEAEEMRAMLELLKGQLSGQQGLISEPRSSPVTMSFSGL